jgi:hypothetical protein
VPSGAAIVSGTQTTTEINLPVRNDPVCEAAGCGGPTLPPPLSVGTIIIIINRP